MDPSQAREGGLLPWWVKELNEAQTPLEAYLRKHSWPASGIAEP